MFKLVFLFALALGVSQGLKCYQCGNYIPTSVTPCLNLTEQALQECPSESTHCATYKHPAMVVYDCATACKEQTNWGFEIQCSDNYKFNGGTNSATPSTVFGIWTILALGFFLEWFGQ